MLKARFIKSVIPNLLGHKMTDIVITILILCLEVPVYHGIVSIWIIFKTVKVVRATQKRIYNRIHCFGR